MYNFALGGMYSFTTRAPAILGSTISRHTLKGIVDYNTACKHENVELLHRQIYPLLPDGTINNPSKYTYLLLRSESGITRVIATVWIVESSITLVEEITATIKLTLDSNDDLITVRETLTLMGFPFTIETE